MVNKIYIVTVHKLNGGMANPFSYKTWTFTNAYDTDEFINALNHYEDISDVKFEYEKKELQVKDMNDTRLEVEKFLEIET
jgi:DUF4097 and DUF4098 domain-containing protein YvlB